MPPTAGQIADALAGLRGPVNLRYRYQQRDHDFNFQADLTDAIISASITLDNDRPVVRTATFAIDAIAMPDGFDPASDHIAVIARLVVPMYQDAGRWETVETDIPMGLFHLDAPKRRYEANGHQFWEVEASDISVHLLTAKFITPYTVVAGTNYVTAVEAILDLLGLRYSIDAVADVTPADYTWAPGTSYWQAIADLLLGINWYNIWCGPTGVFTTKPRIDPATETAAVDYSTATEPRMLNSPFERALDRTRFANRIAVVIDDPRRTPEYAVRVNNDPDSPISVAALSDDGYAVVNSDPEISGGFVVNVARAQEIADFELKDRSGRADAGTLLTFADPRRAANESYALTIESVESASLWRVNSWKLALAVGATMTHEIDFSRAITTSIVVTLGGTILTADAAEIVTGGDTITLTMPTGYAWVAAGAVFDAIRQDIIDGLVSSGSAVAGWNAEVVPTIAVTDVVRTSATLVTITLPAVAGYVITVPEEVTCTVPTSAIDGAYESYTEPTFTIIP